MASTVPTLPAMMAMHAILAMRGAVAAFAAMMPVHAVLPAGARRRTGETQRRQRGRRQTQLA